MSATVKPFEAIPVVPLPTDYERELPRWTAEQAVIHGPIFRVAYPRICICVNCVQVEIRALAAHVLRTYALESLAGQGIA